MDRCKCSGSYFRIAASAVRLNLRDDMPYRCRERSQFLLVGPASGEESCPPLGPAMACLLGGCPAWTSPCAKHSVGSGVAARYCNKEQVTKDCVPAAKIHDVMGVCLANPVHLHIALAAEEVSRTSWPLEQAKESCDLTYQIQGDQDGQRKQTTRKGAYVMSKQQKAPESRASICYRQALEPCSELSSRDDAQAQNAKLEGSLDLWQLRIWCGCRHSGRIVSAAWIVFAAWQEHIVSTARQEHGH